MSLRSRVVLWAVAACCGLPVLAEAQTGSRTDYLKPLYLPPAELSRVLGVREVEGRGVLTWQRDGSTHTIEVRRNDASNLLVLLGDAEDVAAVEAMIQAVDVAPRQILIEAKVVEIDEGKALDAGIDWPNLRADVQARGSWQRTHQDGTRESRSTFGSGLNREITSDKRGTSTMDAALNLSNALRLLEEKGAATFRDAPRILTLNNRRATILDGQRVTYVTRYSSFTNLFETDTLDAGLSLSVLPSLGESGYLTLDLRAELTSVSDNISGSPVKDGQIVENTVIARNGETILIGGFLRTSEERSQRRFPVLGRILPFLFSRETSKRTRRESFILVTPRVVDLEAGLDPETRDKVQDR